MKQNVIIGIYKITNPKGKIYIGQSIDILKRFNQYKLLHCKAQRKLYNSLLKYGVDKHLFEIIIECDILELNENERYYQEIYFCLGMKGLNLCLVNSNSRSGKHSEETKKLIGLKSLGRFHSKETKLKNSLSKIGRKHTEEHKLKIGIGGKGKKLSNITKIKMSNSSRFSKEVLNVQTGVFYNSIKEASNSCNIKHRNLISYLSGQNKNKTDFILI